MIAWLRGVAEVIHRGRVQEVLSDLEFAVNFARSGGRRLVNMRSGVGRSKKLDGTDLSDADTDINRRFVIAVGRRSGGNDSVLGEEQSEDRGSERVWVIDPNDGTTEYLDDTVPSHLRTSCVGISLMVRGVLVLSVVFNPFRDEMFIAQAGTQTTLNGRAIRCSTQPAARGVPYSYAHWSGARHNLPRLERTFGRPLGVGSAIYQACMVATGRSAFAAFAGDTIHDIAPAALLVMQAGGLVTNFHGGPVNWLQPRPGVLYANRASHRIALGALRTL